MASQTGIIKLEGTIAGLTFVKSTRYRRHVRRARGSVTKTEVNSSLRGNADNATPVTCLASSILKELKPLDRGFVGGDFWGRFIGRMFKSKQSSTNGLLESLSGLELNERYTFAGCFSSSPELILFEKEDRVLTELKLSSHPNFPPDVKAESYLYRLIILFLDGKGNCVPSLKETDWISYKESPIVWKTEFEKPREASHFLIVEGVVAGENNERIESFTARGYRISQSGEC